MLWRSLCALVCAYLLGSVSGAIVTGYMLHRVDIRSFGSGNAGLTNTLRTLGPQSALLTLTIDVLKTLAALLLGRALAGETGLLCAAGGVLLGHAFPVYYRFRGGKCVLSTAVIALVFDWRAFLVLAAVFFWVTLLGRRVSIGSLTAAPLLPFTLWAFGSSLPRVLLSSGVIVLVLILHRDNLRRLLRGEEPPLKF